MIKSAIVFALLGFAPLSLSAGSLTMFASGEDLATEGFSDPKLTKDGWALEFTSISATFDQITAWQTDPPFLADRPKISGTALPMGGPFTVDLVKADKDHRVALTTTDAISGHYNAVSWAMIQGADGYSLVLKGVARKNGQKVEFLLRTTDTAMHTCGEYLGNVRKGFVTDGTGSDLEITLHLDHLFGRADKAVEDQMNRDALGFDVFAMGGVQDFSLTGLHLGHVGEGHCHVSAH